MVVCETDGSGDDEIPNAAFAECRNSIRLEEKAESVRVLYVAITRARDRLIISEGANRHGWSKPLRELVGAEALANFEDSQDVTREINCDGAQILLRRPDLKKLTPVRISSDEARNPEQSQLELVKRRLTDLIEETGRLTITPTELADFDRCPRQYWFRHGLGIPENSQLARRGTGNAAALGSVAHAVMERVKLDDKNPPTEAELHRLAQTFAASAGIDTVQCMAVAHDLSRYIGSRSRSESVIGREVPFMINLAPQLFMRGQIDAVVRVGNALMVRDYKYISHPEAEHYQIQMECYALAVAMVNPGYSVEAELVALRSAPASFRVKLPSLDTIHKRLVGLGHEIAQARVARDFSKKPVSRSLCYELGCGYVARCWKD